MGEFLNSSLMNLLNCPNRIKPKLLREQKTEALLVFIRTTLEQSFKEIKEKGSDTKLIDSLKSATYKSNIHRKSKRRKR